MTDNKIQILTSSDDSAHYVADNLIELLEKRANDRPDRLVYIFLEDGVHEKQRITFKELSDKAKSIASVLQSKGNKGDRVLLIFPNGIDFIISLFGVFYAGMIGVPAYAPRKNRNNSRFESVVGDCGAKILLTNQQINKDLQKNFMDEPYLSEKEIMVFEDISSSSKWTDPVLNPEDLAILQYTSGSTGTPNGVMVSHQNIIHNLEIINQGFGHDENSMGTNWLPNFHDMGLIGALLQPVYAGFCNVIIPPGEFIRNPANWLRAISRYKTTTAGGPNFTFDYCIDKISDEEKEDIDLSSLKVLFCGAEPIQPKTLKSFAENFGSSAFSEKQFYPCYGLAEYSLMVTGGKNSDKPIYFEADTGKLEIGLIEPASDPEESTCFVACGYPWLGTTVAIVNPETKEFNKGNEIGEIWVKGNSRTQGYWNNPEETEYTFNAYIHDNNDGPYLRTGDLGFIHDGQLYVTGRIKDLIIIRGLNHYPQDIEKTAEAAHEALQPNASAAFSIIAANEERLVLVHEIKRTHLRDYDAEEIYDAIRLSVSYEHQVLPYSILLIRTGSIPKTSSGKIQRLASKKAYRNDELIILDKWVLKLQENVPFGLKYYSSTELKSWLTNWLASKKGIEPASIDPDKPIAAYGLDSILAINLEKDVNETFGISWPIESFLQENTINSLVKEGLELLKALE